MSEEVYELLGSTIKQTPHIKYIGLNTQLIRQSLNFEGENLPDEREVEDDH
jgi:hypothetical protein